MNVQSVAIIGGGVTGLVAAAKFKLLGHRVAIIERRKIGPETGGGIDIHPNGTKILFSLGITDKFKEVCAYNNREIRLSIPDRSTINCVPLNLVEKDPKYPMLSFCRTDLIRILFDNVKNSCEIYEEAKCTQIEMQDDSVSVTINDNKKIVADILIGADGVNSVVRKFLFPDVQKQYLGHISLGGNIPTELYKHNYVYGLQRTCVVFPCNQKLAHTVMFCPKPEGWLKSQSTFEEYKKPFTGWSEEVDTIIDHITEDSRFCVESHEIPPLESYAFKRIFLAGDAAHAMSPLGALATTLALEDIQELADQFSDDTQTLEQICENYNSKRIPRAKEFRDFSIGGLVPTIVRHTQDDYNARIERLKALPPKAIFAPLANLTQTNITNPS